MKTIERIVRTVSVLLATTGVAYADGLRFEGRLSGAQEVVADESGELVPGGTDTDARGRVRASFNRALSRVGVNLRVRNLSGTFAAAHFHCGRAGQNGPVALGLIMPGPLSFDGERIIGELTNADFTGADCIPAVGRPVNNIAALALAMRDGLIYTNVHTSVFPAGEVRAQMLPRNHDD